MRLVDTSIYIYIFAPCAIQALERVSQKTRKTSKHKEDESKCKSYHSFHLNKNVVEDTFVTLLLLNMVQMRPNSQST